MKTKARRNAVIGVMGALTFVGGIVAAPVLSGFVQEKPGPPLSIRESVAGSSTIVTASTSAPGPPLPIREWVTGVSEPPERIGIAVDYDIIETGEGWIDPVALFHPSRGEGEPVLIYSSSSKASPGDRPIADQYRGVRPARLGSTFQEARAEDERRGRAVPPVPSVPSR